MIIQNLWLFQGGIYGLPLISGCMIIQNLWLFQVTLALDRLEKMVYDNTKSLVIPGSNRTA